jgi:hypothetical protein
MGEPDMRIWTMRSNQISLDAMTVSGAGFFREARRPRSFDLRDGKDHD